MAAPFILLFALALYIILKKPKYDFKTFLLTMKDQTTRQKNFFASHGSSVPIEVIYGKNTRDNIETAREFEDKSTLNISRKLWKCSTTLKSRGLISHILTWVPSAPTWDTSIS